MNRMVNEWLEQFGKEQLENIDNYELINIPFIYCQKVVLKKLRQNV